jgi:hypothetical protein
MPREMVALAQPKLALAVAVVLPSLLPRPWRSLETLAETMAFAEARMSSDDLIHSDPKSPMISPRNSNQEPPLTGSAHVRVKWWL